MCMPPHRPHPRAQGRRELETKSLVRQERQGGGGTGLSTSWPDHSRAPVQVQSPRQCSPPRLTSTPSTSWPSSAAPHLARNLCEFTTILGAPALWFAPSHVAHGVSSSGRLIRPAGRWLGAVPRHASQSPRCACGARKARRRRRRRAGASESRAAPNRLSR